MNRTLRGCLLLLGAALGALLCQPLAAQSTAPAAVAATWVNVTGNLANMASECGNLTIVSAVPGSGNIIAGVANSGLWINSSGSTWSLLGGPPRTIPNRPSSIAYDPSHPSVFWESGIYGSGGGIFKTIDNGNSFQQLGSISHNDYVSVDFSDPNRQTLLAGGHEQSQTVHRSTNGGQSWTNVGVNLPANTKFSINPLIISSQVYLVNAQGYSDGVAGIFRTTDGGTSWQQVSTLGPPVPPLVTSTGVIYWPFGGGLLKSTNAGLSWTQVGSNLFDITPVELPDGTLVSVSGSRLASSADGGSNWSALGPNLPFTPASLTYSPTRQAFFISHWDCGNVVLPDAIMRLDFSFSIVPPPPGNLRILSQSPS